MRVDLDNASELYDAKLMVQYYEREISGEDPYQYDLKIGADGGKILFDGSDQYFRFQYVPSLLQIQVIPKDPTAEDPIPIKIGCTKPFLMNKDRFENLDKTKLAEIECPNDETF